jgi:hemerythrin
MRQIVSVASEHFAVEERLMESSGYTGLAAHRAKHRELAGKIAEFVARHQKGDTTVYVQLLYFIRDWQTKHMQTEDHEYAPWLKAHGVR